MSTHEQVVTWMPTPDPHDYPAAASYLSMVLDDAATGQVVATLRSAQEAHYKAKDILRASRLDLLPTSNVHVTADLAKVKAGKPLSPILMVRGNARTGTPALIADGYHRVCASYYVDENTDIPVLIADLPEG